MDRQEYRCAVLIPVALRTDYLFEAELEPADVRPGHVEEYLGGLPRQGSDPETWRRFMNHADLSQWSRYVAGTDERVRAAIPKV